MRILYILLCFILTSPAYAVGNGMYLCRSPVVANDFWGSLRTVQQTGVDINKEVAASIAKQNECKYVAGNNLKPVDFVTGELAITDGKFKGWADPHLYIIYVNKP